MNSPHLAHFPADYFEARKRFLEYSAGPGRESGKWRIPSGQDFDLYVDHVYLPPLKKPDRLFTIVSGIHGLEAYAGSAIQSMFFTEILPLLDRSNSGFLVVHCMNPFGFKYHRRCTENEVNLNRNCSTASDLFEIKNPESLKLSERFVPQKPVDSLECELLKQMKREGSQVSFGGIPMDEFTKAVSQGQYSSPDGLEFGGHGPEPQVRALSERLQQLIPLFSDIILLDLHTGLGERGRMHLLSDDHPRSINASLFAELFDRQSDRDVYEFTPSDAEGFYPTYGALNGLFPEIASPEQRVCALTMEFATLGHDLAAQIDGLNRWMLEHQGAHYGYANAELERQVKEWYLERFFPKEDAWKANVLNLSKELFTRVLVRAGLLK